MYSLIATVYEIFEQMTIAPTFHTSKNFDHYQEREEQIKTVLSGTKISNKVKKLSKLTVPLLYPYFISILNVILAVCFDE